MAHVDNTGVEIAKEF